MTDSGRTDPIETMFTLVAGPFTTALRSFDQLRRGTEEMMKGVENFNATMKNLNETAARINRLLNDFEEPIRAWLPQITRTLKMTEELSNRLSLPAEQLAPGLARLAETLNNPVFSSMPRDLGQFMDIINDVGHRMSPLAQLAEQAGSMFGLRLPGFARSNAAAADADEDEIEDEVDDEPEERPSSRRATPASRRPAAKKSAAKRSSSTRSSTRRSGS